MHSAGPFTFFSLFAAISGVVPTVPVEHSAEVLLADQRMFRSENPVTGAGEPHELDFFSVTL